MANEQAIISLQGMAGNGSVLSLKFCLFVKEEYSLNQMNMTES